MMRSNRTPNDSVPMTMPAHFRMFGDEVAHELAPFFYTFRVRVATSKGCFGSRLITATPCRHKDDSRQQVVKTQCRQQSGRRHLGHFDLHSSKIVLSTLFDMPCLAAETLLARAPVWCRDRQQRCNGRRALPQSTKQTHRRCQSSPTTTTVESAVVSE